MPLRFGIGSRPRLGERSSGDGAWIVERDHERLVLVVDALGHGAIAAREIEALSKLDWANWQGDSCELVQRLHRAMSGGRGAAAMVCLFRQETDMWLVDICGVGNVRAGLLGEGRVIEGVPGVLGGRLVRSLRAEAIALDTGTPLAIATDGMSRELWAEKVSPSVDLDELAASCLRQFGSERDDATVVLVRAERGLRAR